MHRPLRSVVASATCMLLWTPVLFGTDVVTSDRVRQSIGKGLALVQSAGTNWTKNKACFSCHHQTLPMLAMIEASAAGLPMDGEWMRKQSDFTHDEFADRHEMLESGEHVPGGAFTVGYALWAMDLAGRRPDRTSALMVENLLKTQGLVRLQTNSKSVEQREGKWMSSCRRPPMQTSEIAATVLAVTGMQRYATDDQKPRVALSTARALKWMELAKRVTQEDRVWRLWGLHRLGGDAETIRTVREEVLKAQKPDGGWAETDERESDAFATGQTLFVLLRTGTASTEPAVLRARDHLIRTQQADGSWLVETHAKPVQKFFENGDPHGKHQFISTAATAWAVAGLAQMLPKV